MDAKIIVLAILLLIGGAQAVCNDCSLQVRPISNNLCQGDSALYEIKVTNIYDQPKAISFSVVSSIPVATNMPSQVIVDPYSSKKLEVSFDPLEDTVGQHYLTITAKGYGAEDSDDAIFTINDCYTLDLVLEKPELELCQKAKGRVDFHITNSGQKQDTYTLSVANIPDEIDVSFIGNTMTLQPGATKTWSITIDSLSDDFAEYDLQLNVQSSQKAISKILKVKIADCYRTIITAPENFTTCLGAGLSYDVTIENKGCVDDDYVIILSGNCSGRLSVDNLHIAIGESKEVTVILDPIYGQCQAIVTAISEHDSASATTDVNILACYDVDVEVIPHEINACNGQPVSFDINVTNTGYYDDVYALDLFGVNRELSKDSLDLKSGEHEVLILDITGTWCTLDDIQFTVRAVGHASDSDSGTLIFSLSGDACADVSMNPAQDPIQISCQGDSYTFYVANTGYVTVDIDLSLDGPEEYVLQPTSITIMPTETRPVALYIFPTGDESEKPEKITIIADDGSKKAYLELEVDLTGPVCTVQRPVLEIFDFLDINDTTNTTDSTYSPTGAVVSGMPEEQLALAVLLVISTVVLLFLILRQREHVVIVQPEPTVVLSPTEERVAKIKAAIDRTVK